MFLFETTRHKVSLFTLLSVSLLLACFAFLTTSITPAHAVTTTPTTMNFQGRLADSSGNIMPDGLYNMQFRLFTVGSGGSAVWSETRENNGTDYRVQVTNGLFSTKLGEASPLSASLFASGSLYFEITMATPATATCSTASCASWESPMTPRHELSTSAYAYNAETLDGYDSSYFATATGASGYIQNTTTPQTADFNITGTGTANILRATTFDRATAGTLTVGGTNATSISLADDTTLASGKTLRVVGDTYTNIDGYPSPTEGQITYDQTNDQLLVYNATLGKWMSDKSDAILVAASNSSQADKNAADYVADGEIGDGQTTLDGDQVEINQALTAGAGKKVILLAGTYTADATILIPNNTTLAGVGAGTLIQLADIDVTDNLIENSDTTTGTGVTIRDLKLDGQKTLNTLGTQHGILFRGMGDSAAPRKGGNISNVESSNFRTEGVYLYNSDNNLVQNNTASANRYGISSDIGKNNIFSNNITSNNTASGVYLGDDYYATVVDNQSYGNTARGYDLVAYHSTISNNISKSNGMSGYYIGSGWANTVTGNVAYSNTSHGIELSLESYDLITGNTLQLNGGSGIYTNSIAHAVLSDNILDDNGGATNNNAIYLDASDSNTITGNSITDTSATTTNYAVNISTSTSDTNYLADNRFSSTPGTSTINDLGTGTVYSNQPLAENGGSITTRTANSTTAFQIQNASGSNILTADTTNGEIEIGSASLAGKLAISDGSSNTATITVEALAGNYTVAIPTITGNDTFCLENLANCADGGVTAVGALDGGTANSTGATITDTTIYLQSASATYGGLVNTSTQTFAGAKTFNDSITLAAAKTVTITGGTTANRPASPTEGMMYYDTTTDQLLTYANGKWQADKSDAILVAANNSSQADKDAAQYVADGTADQTEINNALTAASGKKVVLLAGTYTASATILVPNNTTLAGVGPGTLIRLGDIDTTDNLIENIDTTNGGDNVVIQDLRLDGQKSLNAAVTQHGIYLSKITNGTVKNVWVDNFKSTGIFLSYSNDNSIINNIVSSNDDDGIYSGYGSHNIFSGNRVQLSGDDGLYFYYSSSNTMSGNIIDDNSGDGIYGLYASLTVTGNTISSNAYGINLANGTDSTITGNYIFSNTKGVYLNNTKNNVISSNAITASGGSTLNDAIYLIIADDNTIVGNNINDNSATTNNYAINISTSTSDANYLADNRFSSTPGTSTINDAGTGTVYSNQPLAENGGSITTRTANSTTAFQIQDASGASVLTVDTTVPRIELLGDSDVSNTSGTGVLTIKVPSSSIEMGIDNNEINVRNSGASSTLYLQNEGGNVEIGTNANAELSVSGDIYGSSDRFWSRYESSSAFGLELGDRAGTNTTNYIDFHTDGSSGTDYNSRIRANAGSNSLLLYSSGGQTCTLSSSWSCTSDKTLKNITGNVTDNLERITQLQPVYFNWKSDPTQTIQIGLVAQDVQEQYPELVITNDDGELSLNYQGLVAPLIGAVKEQQAQIEQTQTMVATLQGGGIENGGAISGNLTVTGDTILTNLSVNGVTTLANLVAVGSAQVQTLDVVENANVQGELTVTGATNVGNIYVNGHIVSIGEKPTITIGDALGTADSIVEIDGTDGAGTVTLQVADTETNEVVLAHVKFNTAYSTDYKVVISPNNAASVKLGAYILKTADGFDIVAANAISAETEYTFDYIVQGISVIE